MWKYARYEFKMSRAKYFTSFIQPDGFFWEEGDTRSVYSKAEVAKHLEGVGSATTVDWVEYGGEPNEGMWEGFAVDALNRWKYERGRGEVGRSCTLLYRSQSADKL